MCYRVAKTLVIASLLVGSACTNQPPNSGATLVASSTALLNRYTAKAHALEREGRLGEARNAWWVVEAISPDGPEVRGHIAELDVRIRARREVYWAAARAADDRGDRNAARRHALTVLLLAPDNNDAQMLLRRLERADAQRRTQQKRLDAAPISDPS